MLFYCKKLLVDAIDSELNFFYRRPVKDKAENLQFMVPYVNLGLQKQKLYIIPDGPAYDEVYAALSIETEQREAAKVTIDTSGGQMELRLRGYGTNYLYSYCTDVFLSTNQEFIYSKITTVSPYTVIMNQSR